MFPFFYVDCNGDLWVPCVCGSPSGCSGSSGSSGSSGASGATEEIHEVIALGDGREVALNIRVNVAGDDCAVGYHD